jgi:hypothetical protein
MKKSIIIILILAVRYSFAQESTQPTNAFKITGKVKNEKTITLSDLKKYNSVELKDVNISCSSKNEEKARTIKGVLLKNILDSVSFQYENRGVLNEFYFLFVASDGYKIVFSFNEIYNTETGNNLYIVTEKEGKDIVDMENRILVLAASDIKAGRRNMKWLDRIVVCRAE